MNDDKTPDNGSTAEEDDEKALVSAEDSHEETVSTSESDANLKPAITDSTNSVAQKPFDILQHLLGLVLTTSALAAASGYLVVNSFLDKYGFFTSLSIPPTVYIGAGITLWLYLIMALFISRIPLHILETIISRWGEQLMIVILHPFSWLRKILVKIKVFDVERTQKIFTSILRSTIAIFGTVFLFHDLNEPVIKAARRYFLLFANLIIWNVLSPRVDDSRYLLGQITIDAFTGILYTIAVIQTFAITIIIVVFKVIKLKVGIVEYTGVVWIFVSVIILVTNYGANLYGYIHKGFGGGAPSKIYIHTTYPVAEDYVGVKVNEKGTTETVCLLVESFDGLVIYNPRTRLSSMFNTGPQSAFLGHSTSLENIDCSPPKLKGLGPLFVSEKNVSE